jgi:hypothetical protein
MWKSNRLFTYIGFGFSLDALFFRFDPDEAGLADLTGATAEIHLVTTAATHRLRFPLTGPAPDTFTLFSAATDVPFTETGRYGTICRRKVIELAVPFKDLHLSSGQEFKLSIAVIRDGLEIERYPRHHHLVLTVPDADFDAKMWKV